MTTALRPAMKSPSGSIRSCVVATAAWCLSASMLSPAFTPCYMAADRRGGAERRQRLDWTVADVLSLAGVATGLTGSVSASSYSPISGRRRGCVGWGAVDHLSDVDMVHMPEEISMEPVVPIDFQQAWAEASRCVNEWVQALAWRFRAFAERRMTELVRSWDDARTEVLYAGHAGQCRADACLFAVLLVGTADAVVALAGDIELSRAAGRLHSKGMGDLSDRAILAQLRDKHPSHGHPIADAAYNIPVDEAALMVDMRVPYQ
eukprot:jgi/Tetstr1/455410/TSEL_042242.t1